MRRLVLALLGLVYLTGQGFSARAQSATSARVIMVDTQDFPAIGVLLDVYDAQGEFVTDLTAADVTVLEDGVTHPIDDLAESYIPAQIVVAINPGPAFSVRDGQGKGRSEAADHG